MNIKGIVFYIAVLCILVFHTPSVAAGVDPSHHPTAESFQKSGYDYLWSVVQSEFDTREFESDADQEEYRRLVDIVIRTGATYSQPYRSSRTGLRRLYPLLLDLDQSPPLYVRYRYESSQAQLGSGVSDGNYIGHAEALSVIAQEMTEAGYPSYVIGATWIRAAEFFRDAGLQDTEQAMLAKSRGLENLVKGASLEKVDPVFQEFVAFRLSKFGWKYSALTESDKELYCRMLTESEDADQWIANYALGNLWSDRAWNARGDSWARDVSSQQWGLFRQYLSKTNAHLTKAWELRPNWPQPAADLITETMGEQFHPDRDEAFWFGEATRARIDLERAYTKYAYSLAPRWGGSIEEMYELMDSVVELSEEQDNMGYILLELIASITRELDDGHAVLLDEQYLGVATELMREEISGPLPYKNTWQLRTALRTVAMGNFKRKNYQECVWLLQAGGGMTDRIFKPWKENHRFSMYAPLLSTPASDSVVLGLNAHDEGDSRAELRAFRDAKKQIDKNPSAIDVEIAGEPRAIIEKIIDQLNSSGQGIGSRVVIIWLAIAVSLFALIAFGTLKLFVRK